MIRFYLFAHARFQILAAITLAKLASTLFGSQTDFGDF